MTLLKKLFIFVAVFTIAALAQEVKIPDYSTTPRSEVPAEYKWKI